MNSNNVRICLLAAGITFAGMFCSANKLAGGAEVGNPAVVCGMARSASLSPLKNGKVYLLSPSYNPTVSITDTFTDTTVLTGIMTIGGDSSFVTVSNDSGKFVFSAVPPNSYNIFVQDAMQGENALRRHITINGGTIDLGSITLAQPATVIFNITDTMYRPQGYLYVPGTSLYLPVTNPGNYILKLPADTVSIRYIYPDSFSNKVTASILATVSANNGDTLDLTNIAPIIIQPTLAYITWLDTIPLAITDSVFSNDSVVRLCAVGAYTNKGSLMEYQFYDSKNNSLSQWSTNATYAMYVSYNSLLYIACRARSVLSSSLVSNWSPTYAVYIRTQQDTLIKSLPTPSPPLLQSMTQNADTANVTYRISKGTSLWDTATIYRLSWTNDTSVFISSWKQDSLVTIPILADSAYHFVWAQIGFLYDTTFVSQWSAPCSTFIAK